MAYGGGIDLAGGTAAMATTELLSNVAHGGTGGDGGTNGFGGSGGNAFGGGLYAGSETVTLTSDTVTGNEAVGGNVGPDNQISRGPGAPQKDYGTGAGGGIEIASAAALSLDSFTLNNTTSNLAGYDIGIFFLLADSNIDGTYLLR
jgi:hypothetical protein